MKKNNTILILSYFVFFIYFVPVIITSSYAQNQNKESLRFVGASSNNFPPMNSLDKKGNLIGFGKELADAVMKAVGSEVIHIHSSQWVEVLKWLDSDQADFIHDTGYTQERDKFLDYSKPILEMPEMIFVRSDQYDITEFNSLKGKKIGCVNKHISHLYLKNFPEIKCYLVRTPVEGLYELISGKIDAFVYPKQIVLYLAQNLRLADKIKMTGKPLRTLTWSMVVKEGNNELLALLNKGIDKVKETGEYDRIYDKWWGKKVLAGYSVRELRIITITAVTISVIIVSLIANILYNYKVIAAKKELEEEIFERKQAEKTLREREAHLKTLIETIPDMIWLKDLDGIYISCNPKFESFFGAEEHEIKGKTDYDFLDETLADFFRENDKAALAKNMSIVNEEEVTYADDGHHELLETIKTPMYDSNGKLIGVLGIARDITERYKTENELKHQKEILQAIIDNIPVLITLYDPNLDILHVNHEFEKIIGWSNDDIKHIDIMEKCYPDPDYRAKALKYIQSSTIGWEQFNVMTRNETKIDSIWSNVCLEDGTQVGIGIDVTDKKRLERQLQQAQKMEAIGTLAGGIAHDFNNMLGIIIGNISYALSQINRNDELHDVLIDVQEGAKQTQNLTQQLLTFSKGGEPIKKVIQLNQIVKDSAEFVIRGAKSKCDFGLAHDLWSVEADSGQLNQVISNLVINANQAMPNGGIIKIQTENVTIDINFDLNISSGKYVKISIQDQGVGIQEKYISNIFEPYFTTKQKGSGLGLATAYSITKRHGGHISVYSETGKGTVFHIYLPASGKNVTESENEFDQTHTGQGKILIMDDQEPILNMVGRMLVRMGYEAMFAMDGSEAVEKYREAFHSNKPFDLVILDLTVPGGMGGGIAIIELLKIDPKVKAIVSSGYSNDPIMSNYEDYGFSGVVPKPYTKAQLSEILNTIFGKK
ncbi:transporter substrate-binding domain-containing protein [Desulfobacterales bacterium HSG16]|nr:transporter substrate-binding domain-containing protein [Desulfobacterales bacterium HSG16]